MNKKNIIIAFCALVTIGVGVWFLTESIPGVSVSEPAFKEFALIVENKKIVSGPTTLEANRGDLVKITVTADDEDEFHLHGYDLSVDLEPSVSKTITFLAQNAGRFMFELERSKVEIGAVEINP